MVRISKSAIVNMKLDALKQAEIGTGTTFLITGNVDPNGISR